MSQSNNLSNVFGASAAAENRLAGILPKKSAAAAAPAPATPAEAPADTGSDQGERDQPAAPAESSTTSSTSSASSPAGSSARATERAEPRQAEPRRAEPVRAAAPATAHDGDADSLTSPVSVYMRPDAIAAARRRLAGRRRLTHADIALDAIETQHSRLPELVAARHQRPGRPAGNLFPGRAGRHNAGGDGPRRTLWTIFLTAAELEVIDRLVGESGATSRSELISAAVEAQLLTARQTTRQRRR